MELKILKQAQNPLFKRQELLANVDAKVTPTHNEIKKLISDKLSTQSENIKIKNIKGSFGSNTFEISANIYDSKQEKDALEIKKKREKQEEEKLIEELKKSQEVAEQPKEETSQPIEEEKSTETPAQEETKLEREKDEN